MSQGHRSQLDWPNLIDLILPKSSTIMLLEKIGIHEPISIINKINKEQRKEER